MSLYNEVRPRTLSEVQGQDNIKNQISGIFASGRIPNAMLFTGPRGTGKTTIARIVAKMLNCESGGAEPCNQCQSCRDIMSGNSIDVIEMDAASNNKVEDVRQIIEKSQYRPLGKYKVFILDEVHMFSTGAWNALLKTIEEPPKNCIFILCTTEEHKVPATIISRCMKFYFEKLELGLVADYLGRICDERGKAYEDDALKLIAQASEGCMRDALSIMESFFETDSLTTESVASTLGMSQENAIFDILMAISKGDAASAISAVKEVSKQGRNLQLLMKGLVCAVSDTLFVLNGTPVDAIVNTAAYKERLCQYKDMIDTARALEMAKQFSSVYGALMKTPDAEFLILTAVLGAIECEAEIDRCYRVVSECKAMMSGAMPSGMTHPVEQAITPSDDIVAFPMADPERLLPKEDVYKTAMEDAFMQPPAIPDEADVMNGDIPSDDVQYSDGFEDYDPFEGVPFPTDVPPQFLEEDEPPAEDNAGGPDAVTPSVEIATASKGPELPFEEEPFIIPGTAPTPTPTPQAAPLPVQKNVSDVAVPANAPSNLLAFLPKGTRATGIDNVPTAKAPAVVNNDVEAPAPQTFAGEQKPKAQADTMVIPGMSAIGFNGFSGWL